jgi:hypothetical protein
MNDPVRRGLRTLLQVGLIQAFIQFAQAFGAHLTGEQIAAITTLATPLLAFVQNLLEDNTGFPSILKAPASGGQNPVGTGDDHV